MLTSNCISPLSGEPGMKKLLPGFKRKLNPILTQ